MDDNNSSTHFAIVRAASDAACRLLLDSLFLFLVVSLLLLFPCCCCCCFSASSPSPFFSPTLFSNNNNRSKVDAYSSGDSGDVDPLYAELVIRSTRAPTSLRISSNISFRTCSLNATRIFEGDKLYNVLSSSSFCFKSNFFLLNSSNANFSDSFALCISPLSFSKVLFKLSKSSAAFEMCRSTRLSCSSKLSALFLSLSAFFVAFCSFNLLKINLVANFHLCFADTNVISPKAAIKSSICSFNIIFSSRSLCNCIS